MVATYPSFPDALAANNKWTQRVVLIDGQVTRCTDVAPRFSRETPVATCRIMMDAPIPPHVQPGANVEVQAGYSGVTATIFSGYIPTGEASLDTDGAWATISAVGWLSLCVDPPLKKMRWQGPIALKEIVRSIFHARKVPYSLVDDIVDDGGAPIMLGTDPLINEGIVEISDTTGLQTWMTQVLGLFSYGIFDQPDGTVRVTRISGQPNATPVMTVTEGQRPSLSFGRRWTTDGMVTYPDVKGATYTDADGVQQQIRSFPETVELNTILRPLGFRKGDTSNSAIDTVALADLVRNEIERNKSELITGVSWKTELAPHIQIGDVVRVTSPSVGADEDVWVTGIAHTTSSGAVTTTAFEGFRGTGSPRPGGVDTVVYRLRTAPVHLGDERVPWYAVPNPSGKTFRVSFTIPESYFSLKLVCYAHGTNSYLLDSGSTDASVSRFVFYQNGEEVSSGNLQSLAEDYEKQLPYGSGLTHWTRLVVPMPGQIKTGVVELEIVSGEDSRLPASTKFDDFEIQMIDLYASGVGEPLFVGEAA